MMMVLGTVIDVDDLDNVGFELTQISVRRGSFSTSTLYLNTDRQQHFNPIWCSG